MITFRFTGRLPAGVEAGALSPDGFAGLPAGLETTVSTVFGQAVPPVFGFVAPLLGLAFVLAIALPARPLRTSAHIDAERT